MEGSFWPKPKIRPLLATWDLFVCARDSSFLQSWSPSLVCLHFATFTSAEEGDSIVSWHAYQGHAVSSMANALALQVCLFHTSGFSTCAPLWVGVAGSLKMVSLCGQLHVPAEISIISQAPQFTWFKSSDSVFDRGSIIFNSNTAENQTEQTPSIIVRQEPWRRVPY